MLVRSARELRARRPADPEDTARLRAHRTSSWKRAWSVDLEGTPVRVEKASLWQRDHRYLVGSRVVAETGSTRAWTPRPTLTATLDLPLHHQVFLLWVELVFSRRNDAAAAAV